MGVVKEVYENLHSKRLNKGKTMMFVGYYLFHISHFYLILNLETIYIITKRYVIWLNVTYGTWMRDQNYYDLPTYELCSHYITPLVDNHYIDPQMVFDDHNL